MTAKVDLRRVLALAAFAAMAIGLFEPHYWKLYAANRRALLAYYTELQYSRMPGFRPFLEEVRARVPEGSSVAIWVPYRQWYGGYSYAWHRAKYVLAGRDVVPLIDSGDRILSDNLKRATFIAAWHGEPQLDGFKPVWRTREGTLARRAP